MHRNIPYLPCLSLWGTISLILMGVAISSCQAPRNGEANHAETTLAESVAALAEGFLEPDIIHSVSIALYRKGEGATFHFGEQNPGQGNPPTDSTLYELASVTKTFTGTLAAKAVLEGKLSLTDDIRDYLPGDYPNLAYEGTPITLQDMLTHTSGFPNFGPRTETKEVFLEDLHQIEITYPPGTRFLYSNTAPEVTAYMLEQAYGMPYRDLVHTFILEPNGMRDTKFTLNARDQARLIQGYNGEAEPQEHFQNSLWGGIAGLHATAPDLLRYLQYHLDESVPEVKESHRNFFSTQYDFDMGYQWNLLEIDGHPCYRHHGGIWGMQNWFMVFPEEQIGIFVLSNASFGGSAFSQGIDDQLEALALDLFELVK
ncbi:MAG: serine hydrolase domain-containing protein [Bacteroidota bacterium]